MKNSQVTLSALLAGAFFLSVTGARGDEGHNHPKAEPHSMDSMKVGAVMSSHDGMIALYAHIQEIESQLADGKLDAMHEHAEAFGPAIKDLDKDTTLNASKKKRVRGYVKNITKLVDKLHQAADAKKMDQAKQEFTKLKLQVNLLDKQFGHSHRPTTSEKPIKGETQGAGK